MVLDGECLSLVNLIRDGFPHTINEVPELQIIHTHTPSPFTPLGSKGLGEGNSMSTPVCIANAIADQWGNLRQEALQTNLFKVY